MFQVIMCMFPGLAVIERGPELGSPTVVAIILGIVVSVTLNCVFNYILKDERSDRKQNTKNRRTVQRSVKCQEKEHHTDTGHNSEYSSTANKLRERRDKHGTDVYNYRRNDSRGISKKIIRLVGDSETACQIGDYSFWFGGETAEKYSAKEYAAVISEDTIVKEIYATLSEFGRLEDYADEYAYYAYYINEHLRK